MFLGGFGEGAKAVALWGAREDVAAYLITGWTCTAPPSLEWLHGLHLPEDRPVLAIVTSDESSGGAPSQIGTARVIVVRGCCE